MSLLTLKEEPTTTIGPKNQKTAELAATQQQEHGQ
jgi:hypothetical protein